MVKINKYRGALLIAVFTITTLAGIFSRRIFNMAQETYSTVIELTNTAGNFQDQPLVQNSPKPDPKLINQLLQQRYMAAVNRQAMRNQSGDDPENREMIEEALKALHSAHDAEDRELAVMTLGEYTTDAAKKGVLFALSDPEITVREQAVARIIEWADPEASRQMILSALKNDNSDIVVLTLESISEIDDAALIDRLHALSLDKNERIREAALMALELSNK